MCRRPVHHSRTPRVRAGTLLVPLTLLAAVTVACSSDGGDEAEPTVDTGAASAPTDDTDTDGTDADGTDATTTTITGIATTVTPSPATVPPTTVPEPTLPEVGVPGLDSDLVVCRAWSRFAGSFQVAAVAASFGDDPLEAARLEVMAAPVVVGAVDEMVDNWPDELADEADLVADGYVGPYGRRAGIALAALETAAADPAVVGAVADLWVDALERRDPSEVLPELTVPDDLAPVIDAAAVAFDAEVVPIPQDPSLVSEVAVPRTEQFLFETCPDRGTLAGSEVDG